MSDSTAGVSGTRAKIVVARDEDEQLLMSLLGDPRPSVLIATPREALAGVFAHWALERAHVPLICRDEQIVELTACRPNTGLIVFDHAFHSDALTLCRRLTDVAVNARRLLYVAHDPRLEASALQAGADAFCALVPGDADAADAVFSRAARLLQRNYLERAHQPVTSRIKQGPMTIDLNLVAAFLDDEMIDLTWAEFRLLCYFAFRPNRTIVASELERLVVRRDDEGSVGLQLRGLFDKLGPLRERFVSESSEAYMYVFDEPRRAS